MSVVSKSTRSDDHPPDQHPIPAHTRNTVEKGTVLPGYGNPIPVPVPVTGLSRCYPYPCIPVTGLSWCYPYPCHSLHVTVLKFPMSADESTIVTRNEIKHSSSTPVHSHFISLAFRTCSSNGLFKGRLLDALQVCIAHQRCTQTVSERSHQSHIPAARQ
jgi:hypothetical protein